MLKHSGVTTLTHAGMDRAAISYAYSTHPDTLQKYYTHLNEEWSAPRQPRHDRICLADFYRPVGSDPDVVALQAVTAGNEVTELMASLEAEGVRVDAAADILGPIAAGEQTARGEEGEDGGAVHGPF